MINLKRLFHKFLKIKYLNKSYSQEGEDLIINRLFSGKTKGFYVDVGSHHPFRFSNTMLFYQLGWKGINIEPNSDQFELFIKYRKRDINLNFGISNKCDILKYFKFNEPALNTFCQEEASLKNKKPYQIVETIELEVKKLSDVLDSYLPEGQEIDFLSIDVEGLEVSVLQSNDWDKYLPSVLIIEILRTSFDDLQNSEIFQFVINKGYVLHSKLCNSHIFVYHSCIKIFNL